MIYSLKRDALVANEANAAESYFTLALPLRRSAQYFFIRALTALRAAADICQPPSSERKGYEMFLHLLSLNEQFGFRLNCSK